ncbi:MAG: peptidase M28 [Flavobacteriaceae bacterium]|nr:peptidase M28 [Flavobacteriaceae bacterium]|tara:strand:- start:1853 stop:3073 length:1221 start_codon:yes stop_codon:yes gene_type:complete
MKFLAKFILFITIISCDNNISYVNRIYDDVNYLADNKLEGRKTGSKGEQIAADYIANRFKSLKIKTKGTNAYFQDFNFNNPSNPHGQVLFDQTENDTTISSKNVIGYIDNNAEYTIVIGAHYDHLGYGGEGSLHVGSEIHNGADDNASGTALMLDLASQLKFNNRNNNYLFIAFSGEEMGLLGSNYFVKNPTIDLSSINYMINLDMVGRLKEDKSLAIYGVGTSPIFKQTINSNNESFNLIENESGVGPSDHTSFYINDIPVLHFFTGQHSDYHKPSDDADKVNFDGVKEISDYIFSIISDLNDDKKLVFKKTKNETEEVPSFKVSLGVMPDYMFNKGGMRIDAVTQDRPAYKAGLIKGDIVIKLGEYDVEDMMGYMKALSKFKSGDSTSVIVKRDQDTIQKKVAF